MRYNYTWAEQENGTFDVDSWGTSANAIEDGPLERRDAARSISTLSPLAPQRVPLPVGPRGPAPPLRRARTSPARAGPLPDTAFDFGSQYRFGKPFFIPVDYFDTRLQFNDNVSLVKGDHTIKVGVEYNRVNAQPDVPRLRRTAATSSARPTAS